MLEPLQGFSHTCEKSKPCGNNGNLDYTQIHITIHIVKFPLLFPCFLKTNSIGKGELCITAHYEIIITLPLEVNLIWDISMTIFTEQGFKHHGVEEIGVYDGRMFCIKRLQMLFVSTSDLLPFTHTKQTHTPAYPHALPAHLRNIYQWAVSRSSSRDRIRPQVVLVALHHSLSVTHSHLKLM